MKGLTPGERAAIDLALVDLHTAAWVAGEGFDERHLRAAYLQGRVDQELGRSVLVSRPDRVPTTERSPA